MRWYDTTNKITTHFTIHIEGGKIEVTCDTDYPTIGDRELLDIYHKARLLCRAATDVVSFASPQTLSVILDRFVEAETGIERPIIIASSKLPQLCTAYDSKHFHSIYGMFATDMPLSMAMRDLIEAKEDHTFIAVNCARAIDAIRKMVSEFKGNEKVQWAHLRNTLNVSEAFLKLITDNSIEARHGFRLDIPAHINATIIERAWKLMNRFLIYRKGGNHPLSKEEFPLLD